jgi:hypothetical protein
MPACPKTKLAISQPTGEKSDVVHDLLAFLAERMQKKNRKKLQVDPARREPAEALKAEFEGSMEKLGPLRERIRQTDELIDRGRGCTG